MTKYSMRSLAVLDLGFLFLPPWILRLPRGFHGGTLRSCGEYFCSSDWVWGASGHCAQAPSAPCNSAPRRAIEVARGTRPMGFFKFRIFRRSTAGSQGQWQRFRRSAGTFQNESGCAAEARLAHGVSPRPVAGKLAGREVTVKRPWLACHARQPIACYQDPPGSHLDGSDEQSERDFAEACAG